MFGIEVKIGPGNVQNIRGFLDQVKEGNPSLLSISFTYDPSLHCFQKETDAVIYSTIFLGTAYPFTYKSIVSEASVRRKYL